MQRAEGVGGAGAEKVIMGQLQQVPGQDCGPTAVAIVSVNTYPVCLFFK